MFLICLPIPIISKLMVPINTVPILTDINHINILYRGKIFTDFHITHKELQSIKNNIEYSIEDKTFTNNEDYNRIATLLSPLIYKRLESTKDNLHALEKLQNKLISKPFQMPNSLCIYNASAITRTRLGNRLHLAIDIEKFRKLLFTDSAAFTDESNKGLTFIFSLYNMYNIIQETLSSIQSHLKTQFIELSNLLTNQNLEELYENLQIAQCLPPASNYELDVIGCNVDNEDFECLLTIKATIKTFIKAYTPIVLNGFALGNGKIIGKHNSLHGNIDCHNNICTFNPFSTTCDKAIKSDQIPTIISNCPFTQQLQLPNPIFSTEGILVHKPCKIKIGNSITSNIQFPALISSNEPIQLFCHDFNINLPPQKVDGTTITPFSISTTEKTLLGKTHSSIFPLHLPDEQTLPIIFSIQLIITLIFLLPVLSLSNRYKQLVREHKTFSEPINRRDVKRFLKEMK